PAATRWPNSPRPSPRPGAIRSGRARCAGRCRCAPGVPARTEAQRPPTFFAAAFFVAALRTVAFFAGAFFGAALATFLVAVLAAAFLAAGLLPAAFFLRTA